MALINALRRIDDGKDDAGRKGIVTLCLGGGNAVAMLVQTE
jgi:acetyl-CoA acetyltransferase